MLLDSDGDGYISAEKIDISQLSPDILEVFTPLFWEMEELEQSLDLEEFIDASMRLYDTLKLPEKNLVLSIKDQWQKPKETGDDNWTFQPKLNKNSMRIAAKWRPKGENVADLLMKKKIEADEKVDQMRKAKEEDELEGWTFQPQIHPNQMAFFDFSNYSYESTNKPQESSYSIGHFKSAGIYSGQYDNFDHYNSQY